MASRTLRPRNAWWYVAAFVLAFGGIMLGVSVAASSWSLLTSATVRPAETPVAAEGTTVGVFADIAQPDREIRCRTGGKGKPQRTIEPTTINPTTTQDGTTWTLIAETSDGFDDLQVVCKPKDGASDPSTYGVSVAEGYSGRLNLGSGIIWVSVTAAVAFGVWVFFSRRRAAEDALASTGGSSSSG